MRKPFDIEPILTFLPCETPDAWIAEAIKPENLPILLIDHLNCERKAAEQAISLMRRGSIGWGDDSHLSKDPAEGKFFFDLLNKMSRLAREELRHFEQVLALIKKRGINCVPLSASRYAKTLRQHVRKSEPGKWVDILIIGALIEARSCERFYRLVPYLDPELAKFYSSLLQSEGRHFQDYLTLAQSMSADPVAERAELFVLAEREAVLSEDRQFRFHSGVPPQAAP